MQLLPKIVSSEGQWRLPMADASAAALVRAWATGDPFLLAAAMAQDPPLTIWAAEAHVCKAGEIPPAAGLLFLAGWLCRRGKAALTSHEVEPPPVPSRERTLSAAELAGRGRLTGELAARLAEECAEGGGPKDRLRLLALLTQREAWLAWGREAAPGAVSNLSERHTTELPEHVRLAHAIECGQASAPAGWNLSPAALEARRAQLAFEWAAPAPPTAWSELADKLEDADLLYDRFDQHVEREKLESMAEFAAGAGHEINNPLAIISGRAQLLLRDERDPERRRELAAIHAQATRVYEMIADMMLFARPPAPRHASVDLAELAVRVVGELAPLGAERGIAVEVFAAEPVVLEADRTQLEVALRALGDNALEALSAGLSSGEGAPARGPARLEISLRGLPSEAELVVRDNGPGIAPEVRRHLFDPYYSGRQAGRGLGNGLAKAWRIVVTNHGGSIDVASEPGGGATFTVRIPRSKPA